MIKFYFASLQRWHWPLAMAQRRPSSLSLMKYWQVKHTLLFFISPTFQVHIFSYLSASAGNLLILSCCHSRLQRLCHDRRVVGDLNFGGDFRVTEAGLKRFLKKNLPVRKLSLSSCYWLNPTQVCNSISGLPGLTSLKMVELRLSASNISSIINSLPNLGDLALTFSTKTIAKVVENLESELGRHEAAFWARLKSLSIALIPSPDDPSTLYTLTHLLATTSSLKSLKIYTLFNVEDFDRANEDPISKKSVNTSK